MTDFFSLPLEVWLGPWVVPVLEPHNLYQTHLQKTVSQSGNWKKVYFSTLKSWLIQRCKGIYVAYNNMMAEIGKKRQLVSLISLLWQTGLNAAAHGFPPDWLTVYERENSQCSSELPQFTQFFSSWERLRKWRDLMCSDLGCSYCFVYLNSESFYKWKKQWNFREYWVNILN